jgi:hypothetical protein
LGRCKLGDDDDLCRRIRFRRRELDAFNPAVLRIVHATPKHNGRVGGHGAQFLDQFRNSHLAGFLLPQPGGSWRRYLNKPSKMNPVKLKRPSVRSPRPLDNGLPNPSVSTPLAAGSNRFCARTRRQSDAGSYLTNVLCTVGFPQGLSPPSSSPRRHPNGSVLADSARPALERMAARIHAQFREYPLLRDSCNVIPALRTGLTTDRLWHCPLGHHGSGTNLAQPACPRG